MNLPEGPNNSNSSNNQASPQTNQGQWADVRCPNGRLICQVKQDDPTIIRWRDKGRSGDCVVDLKKLAAAG